VVDIPAVNGV